MMLETTDLLGAMRALRGRQAIVDVAVFGSGLHIKVDDEARAISGNPVCPRRRWNQDRRAGADSSLDGGRIRRADRRTRASALDEIPR